MAKNSKKRKKTDGDYTPNKKARSQITPKKKQKILSADEYYELADADFKQEDYDKAIENFTLALNADIGFDIYDAIITYIDRGSAYYNKKDYDQAIADYDMVLQLLGKNSNSAVLQDAYRWRGDTHSAKGNYQQALADYKQVWSYKLTPAREIEAYLGLGLVHAKANNHDEALKCYNKVLDPDLKPSKTNSALAYSYIAKAYWAKKEYDEAIKYFKMALGFNPNNQTKASISYDLGDTYFSLAKTYKDDVQKKEACAKAIEHFTASLALKKDVDTYNAIANAYELQKEYDKAIAEYQQALILLEKKPDDKTKALINYNLGVTYFNLAKTYKKDEPKIKEACAKAIKHFTAALALKKDVNTYNLRADAYFLQEEYDKVIADYQQALELLEKKPDDKAKALVNYNLGDFYFELAKTYKKDEPKIKEACAKAIKHFTASLKLKEDVDTYVARANVYDLQEEYDKAIADYQQALELKPDDSKKVIILNDLGHTYFNKKEYGKAIEFYTLLLNLEEDANTYNNRGLAYNNQGDYDNATEDYKQALELLKIKINDKLKSDVIYNLGLANDNKYEHVNAIKYYSASIELKLALKDESFVFIYFDRAENYYKLQQYGAGTEDYDKAISNIRENLNSTHDHLIFKQQLKSINETIRILQNIDEHAAVQQTLAKLNKLKQAVTERLAKADITEPAIIGQAAPANSQQEFYLFKHLKLASQPKNPPPSTTNLGLNSQFASGLGISSQDAIIPSASNVAGLLDQSRLAIPALTGLGLNSQFADGFDLSSQEVSTPFDSQQIADFFGSSNEQSPPFNNGFTFMSLMQQETNLAPLVTTIEQALPSEEQTPAAASQLKSIEEALADKRFQQFKQTAHNKLQARQQGLQDKKRAPKTASEKEEQEEKMRLVGHWGETYLYEQLKTYYCQKYNQRYPDLFTLKEEPNGTGFSLEHENKPGLVLNWLNKHEESYESYDMHLQKLNKKNEMRERTIEIKSTRDPKTNTARFKRNEIDQMRMYKDCDKESLTGYRLYSIFGVKIGEQDEMGKYEHSPKQAKPNNYSKFGNPYKAVIKEDEFTVAEIGIDLPKVPLKNR
ncbi:MAG: peptidase caspase catalytic subunit p20 [Gammaproteobacteria bacterium]|jgi:tetratricopeptide (TPR) repeat protein|nr:peptidase caspase catalytic subunit p20 [Gammaproteobacteria bacterium]